MEIGRGHADYAVGQAVEANRFANDGGIGSESQLPSAVAEHSVRAGTRMQVIVLVEYAAHGGLDAQRVEVVARGEVSPNALRTTIRL